MRNAPLLALLLFVCSAHNTGVAFASNSHNVPHDTRPLVERLRGPIVGGHQGLVFSTNPNTMAAFKKAVRLGADIIEMDVRVSRNGIPIVFHDATLETMTTCLGHVRTLPMSVLEECRMRFSNEHITTLEEVLLWSHGNVIINVELKEDDAIVPALELVATHDAYEWVYFQVQNDEQYRTIRSHDQRVALLRPARTHDALDAILATDDPRTIIIELRPELQTPSVMRDVASAGKLVSVNAWRDAGFHEIFTVSCLNLFRAGVDIAITNRPAVCAQQKRQFLQEQNKKKVSRHNTITGASR